MLVKILGSIGFLCYFIYDINSITKNYKLLNKLFFLGSVFVAAGTFEMFRSNWNIITFHSIRVWCLMIWCLIMFGGMVYTLFFAIPFKQTYMEENRQREAYTEGIYAICRHPGVLWFIGLYLGIAGLIGKAGVLMDAVVYIGWNIGYIVLQDKYIFPQTFTNYCEYQRSTPFLLPDANSVRRAFKTYRKGN